MNHLVFFGWLASAFVIVAQTASLALGSVVPTDGTPIGDTGLAAIGGSVAALVAATWRLSGMYSKVQDNLGHIKEKVDKIERSCAICRNDESKDSTRGTGQTDSGPAL